MNRKEKVAAAFSAAAATYEGAARAQARSAENLALRAAALPRPAYPRVLEFGCGTGLLTRRLHPVLGGDWLVTDISPAMINAARTAFPTPSYRLMDAETPDLGEKRFDLIVSNLAAQWFVDLGAAAARLAGLLAPGGHLLFSTLAADSFEQWRAAHAELGLSCGIPAFPDGAALAACLPASARIERQVFTLDYADGRAFAKELKLIGAGTPTPGHHPLAVAEMRRLFTRLGQPATMTYDVAHILITAE